MAKDVIVVNVHLGCGEYKHLQVPVVYVAGERILMIQRGVCSVTTSWLVLPSSLLVVGRRCGVVPHVRWSGGTWIRTRGCEAPLM